MTAWNAWLDDVSMRLLVLAVVAVAALLPLSGCDRAQPPRDDETVSPILADDLDLDSYRAEGVIDGLTWTADLCALNLIPTWDVYFEGEPDPAYRMQFQAYDSSIDGGVVTGQWQLGDGPDHPVQITNGTFSVATDPSAQKPGTISVDRQVKEYLPGGGSVARSVSGAFDLTPVVVSPGCTVTDTADYLTEALKTYSGPAGGGM